MGVSARVPRSGAPWGAENREGGPSLRGIFESRASRRTLAVVAVSGLGVLSAAGIASTGGSASQAPGDTATLTAEFQQGRLVFSPRNVSIASGGRLTIANGRPIPH